MPSIDRVEPSPGSPHADALLCAQRRIAQLEEALAARDEFIATVGHELRNPLAPILLQIERLIEAPSSSAAEPVPEWMRARLRAISSGLHRFVEVLNRLLDISRMQAGHIDLVLEDVDLAEVTREVCTRFERELAAARSELAVHVAPVVGRWDRLRLEQIATNLLSNAIRYGAGRPIEVRVEADAASARLIVRDEGVGIAEQDFELIFRRFERVSSSRSSGGLGMGLWLVQTICRALGGSIEVRSRLGEGSTFIVTLPRGCD
jgi:signal transduction histidine kinase